MADLRGRSARGGAIALAGQSAKFALRFGSTMILARLLTPEDFGLIAMVTAIVGFIAMFQDGGLSMATIQSESITQNQVSTMFWINVCLSIFLTVLTLFVAPLIANFYKEPRLIPVTFVLAGTFIFGGVSVQHQALLRRQMRITELTTIEIASLLAGILAALLTAVWFPNYWALVAMIGISSIVYACGIWIRSGWIPGMPRRRSGVRPMLTFGANTSGTAALTYAGNTLDNVLVGWWIGSGALGVYSKSFGLFTLPLRNLISPLGNVAIPALSRLVENSEQYRRSFALTISLIHALVIPIATITIVFAPEVVRIALGSQWDQAGPVLRIFGFAGLILPFWTATSWLWISQSRMHEFLRFSFIDLSVQIVVMPIGLIWGLEGLALAITFKYFLLLPLLIYALGTSGPISCHELAQTLTYPAILALYCLLVCTIIHVLTSTLLSPLLLLGTAFITVGLLWYPGNLITSQGREVLTNVSNLPSILGFRHDSTSS